MDLDNEELEAEKKRRNFIEYQKYINENKDVPFDIYKNMYNDLCQYMIVYNEAEQEVEYMKKLLDVFVEYIDVNNRFEFINYKKDSEEKRKAKIITHFKEELRKRSNINQIAIPLKDKVIEDIEYYYQKGNTWYAHFKDKSNKQTNKVTEQELKDMILGMLE